MDDMSPVIEPNSDQYNAESFLTGPRTFCIESVSITPGQEQPVSINLVGETLVWRPCKSMSRCLVAVWGRDAKAYVGKSLTLYNDPKVRWGGMEVGGIRISHMSHITAAQTMVLAESKKSRKPFTVKPLKIIEPAAAPPPTGVETSWLKPLEEPNGAVWIKNLAALLASAQSQDEVTQIGGHNSVGNATAKAPAAVRARISEMLATAFGKFSEPVIDGPMFDEPASDEPLPEVAIAGEAKMAAG